MSRNNTSKNIHVVIDVEKASKCMWCGTLESKKWNTSREGKIFCSSDCRCAYYHTRSRLIITSSVAVGLPLALIFFLIPGGYGVSVGIALLVGFAVIVNYQIYAKGVVYAQKVKKNSRTRDGETELDLIRQISKPIACPNCDGNIDLSKIKEDRIYHCEYCGATGLVEVIQAKR